MRFCVVCGAEFEPRNGRQRYCSRKCSELIKRGRVLALRVRQRAAARKPRKCPTCGVVFKPHDKRQLYCCRTCLRRAKRRASVGKPEADAANPRAFRIRREDEIARPRASVPQIERVRAWLALPPAERYATRDTLTKEDLRLAQKLYLAEPARTAAVNDLVR